MFARHTPTRMRGSGVVQSLKSLASKLHPQLPLSPKESQRLLTALTSSFRAKLDEAHPPRAQDEDTRPKVDRGSVLNSGNHALHTSSVTFADKHLASILTNPLLAKSYGTKKPVLNVDTAKRELEQNPERDPISLLEEYDEMGAATIPIANLCLRTFMDSLVNLSTENRQTKVVETEAGVRTLRWLWRSKLFETTAFLEDRGLMGAIVTMMFVENKESFLWDWLRLNQTHESQKDASGQPRYHHPTHVYRWKDFMLRQVILTKYDKTNAASLNDVFDAWIKAVDLKLDIDKGSTANCLPLGASVKAINDRVFNHRRERKKWEVQRYDRYIETIYLADNRHSTHWTDYYKAMLRLTHPRDPTPFPMFESLKASFEAEPTSNRATIWTSLVKDREKSPNRQKIRLSRYFILVETANQLKDRGHTEELDWIVSRMVSAFPDEAPYLAENLGQGHKPSTPPASPSRYRTIRVPLPSFTGSGAV